MQKEERFWEIDSLRGIAIILMVSYHLVFDILYFSGKALMDSDFFWLIYPRTAASMFFLLVGVSLSLSSMKSPARKVRHYIFRGAGIFLLGMVITLATYLFTPDEYIVFGALHFIGISVILGSFFLSQGKRNIAYAIACIAFGICLSSRQYSSPYLLWLGFIPQGFRSLDYFPLLPWFGLVLLGIYIGKTFYAGYNRRISIHDYSKNPFFSGLSFLGRHSLLIYFLHQPAILIALYLAGFISPGFLS